MPAVGAWPDAAVALSAITSKRHCNAAYEPLQRAGVLSPAISQTTMPTDGPTRRVNKWLRSLKIRAGSLFDSQGFEQHSGLGEDLARSSDS